MPLHISKVSSPLGLARGTWPRELSRGTEPPAQRERKGIGPRASDVRPRREAQREREDDTGQRGVRG
eukprot:6207182-Pleurochrysis_carterae.AAC.1